MNRIVAFMIIGLLALSACTQITEPAQNTTQPTDEFQGVNVEAYVAAWIQDAPTYAYDGQELALQEHVVLESYPEQHVLTYTFVSTHAGYGDRSGEIVAQVLTQHEIVVRAVDGEIARAVIDERWDVLAQEYLESEGSSNQSAETTLLTYTPKQCEDDPWDEWYAQGNITYVQEPTEEQLITDYYASMDIQAQVERVQGDMFTCQACGCAQTYRFEITVDASSTAQLQTDGWN